MAPVRDEWAWVDARSGSIKRQTEWLFGIKTEEVIQPSSLELWVREHGRSHEHQWRTLAITSKTLFGHPVVFACGMAPPIYQLRPLMGDFVAMATDEELEQFVQVLDDDAENEQEEAVRLASERVMSATMSRLPLRKENSEAINRR